MDNDKKTLYRCDPKKNKHCRKTGCYLKGGECRQTTVKAFAKDVEYIRTGSNGGYYDYRED